MIVITQCCIHELYLAGRSQQAAVVLAKTFERRKCNHRVPIPGIDCVTSVVGTPTFVKQLARHSDYSSEL
jgi:U3 small nucleolar RNA-associated protein 23